MGRFIVTVSEGDACAVDYREFKAGFESKAETERGILDAASKALNEKYGRDFTVTTHDIAEKICNAETGEPTLRYIDTMQKQGLWQ